MRNDLLDDTLLLEICQSPSRQRPVDFQSVHQHRDRDELVRLHILVEFVRGGFVEDDCVVGLVLDLTCSLVRFLRCQTIVVRVD